MRTVTYGAACSLDGFIAGTDGAIDWLHHSSDVTQIMKDYWADVDTILMGRKTWEFANAFSGKKPKVASTNGSKKRKSKARNSSGISTYVFSRTMEDVPGSAELVSRDAGGFVRDLKTQPGKGICLLGGGELAQSLFEAGVIDVVGLNIHPVLLGSGVPLFRDPGRRIALELIASRTLQGGCVYATYRVKY